MARCANCRCELTNRGVWIFNKKRFCSRCHYYANDPARPLVTAAFCLVAMLIALLAFLGVWL